MGNAFLEAALAASKEHTRKETPVLLAHHITISHLLPVLLFSAGIALVVTDRRARDRNEKQAQLQHAAYELGLRVARDGTPVTT